MNTGAERINVAADKFVDAGRSVAGVMTQTAVVAKSMDIASQSLSDGAKAFSTELQDHQSRRKEMAELQREVCAIAESARLEVGLTADVLQRIGGSVSRIQDAQGELDKYLDKVNCVLEKSTKEFEAAVIIAIQRVNIKFHEDLVRSVNLLSGGIDHLEQVLNDLPSAGGDKV
jgi:putative membrane protein